MVNAVVLLWSIRRSRADVDEDDGDSLDSVESLLVEDDDTEKDSVDSYARYRGGEEEEEDPLGLEDFRVPRDQFHILSFDGGGSKGVMELCILEVGGVLLDGEK